MKELLKELKAMNLPRKAYKTIRGQILAGDLEGARRGMERIKRKSNP